MAEEHEPREPKLVERTVRLLVSQDTNLLWEELGRRLGLHTFDELAQVLVMFGAFLVASADQGYLENITLAELGPEQIRAVVWPWLRRRTAGAQAAE